MEAEHLPRGISLLETLFKISYLHHWLYGAFSLREGPVIVVVGFFFMFVFLWLYWGSASERADWKFQTGAIPQVRAVKPPQRSPTVPDFRKSSLEAESSVKAKNFSTTPIRRSVSQYASCFGCRWSEERKIFVCWAWRVRAINSEQQESWRCCLVFISHLSSVFMRKHRGRGAKKRLIVD